VITATGRSALSPAIWRTSSRLRRRQAHVGEAEVVAIALQPLLRLGDRAYALHAEPHLDQRQLEQLADVGLVIDDQDIGAARRGARSARFMRRAPP